MLNSPSSFQALAKQRAPLATGVQYLIESEILVSKTLPAHSSIILKELLKIANYIKSSAVINNFKLYTLERYNCIN